MTPRPEETVGSAVAVFPYLKTTDSIRLGSFTFRSTDDLSGLTEEQAAHVREVSAMLFLQDDLRIRSASCAVCPALDYASESPSLVELYNIQTIVAYAYGSPQPPSVGPLFQFEQASLVIFRPDLVSLFLVRPQHHVESTSEVSPDLAPDQFQRVGGYYGLYNFRHHFWVAKGSRVYSPVPHLGLNIAQDFASDLDQCFRTPHHHLLPQLLRQPASGTAGRVLTSLEWYNRANSLMGDDQTAMIHLAVAFETLLGLPRDAKTDRFLDAVSLLLGRIDRLALWAAQFYAARSEVAHEGRTTRFYFSPTTKTLSTDSPLYGSLLGYG